MENSSDKEIKMKKSEEKVSQNQDLDLSVGEHMQTMEAITVERGWEEEEVKTALNREQILISKDLGIRLIKNLIFEMENGKQEDSEQPALLLEELSSYIRSNKSGSVTEKPGERFNHDEESRSFGQKKASKTNKASEEDVLPIHHRIEVKFPEIPFQQREALNVLRGNLLLSGYNLKIISLTSCNENEGKSFITVNLVQSLAALSKRVLYLDCDIRNSVFRYRYEIHEDILGLSDYLCGNCPLEDILCGTQDPNLDLLFSGSTAPNPSELIAGERFELMIERLRKHYDYIILDTPPVNEVSEAVLVCKCCDGTVLVVESGRTKRNSALQAKRQLEYAGVKLLGVCVNKIGSKKGGYG